MRTLFAATLAAGTLLALSTLGASAQGWYGPGPHGWGSPPPRAYSSPPFFAYGSQPVRCWLRSGWFGPERVCRRGW